jgi:hypothetical protein
MAYSTPITAVANAAFTAAQYNASDRDDMLVTPAALASTGGRIFVSTGANAIAERAIQTEYLSASGTTTNTSFVNLGAGGTGPSVTSITTGTLALVSLQVQANNSSGGASSRMSYDISGATTSAATDDRGTLSQNSASSDTRYGVMELQTLTGGSNTFVCKYRVSSGTGSFSARTMIVIAL